MAYKGKYKVKNVEKYVGDPLLVTYRSSWERALMYFCDTSPKVTKWGSEVAQIPYICKTDGKMHTYYIDFVIKFKNVKTWYLIEVKPHKETKAPRNSKNKLKLLKETFKYAKNTSKWDAASIFAAKKNMKFEIWTEKELKALGLTIL